MRNRLDEIEDRIIREWHSARSPSDLLRNGLLEAFRHGVEEAVKKWRDFEDERRDLSDELQEKIQPAPAEEVTVTYGEPYGHPNLPKNDRRKPTQEATRANRRVLGQRRSQCDIGKNRRSGSDRRKP